MLRRIEIVNKNVLSSHNGKIDIDTWTQGSILCSLTLIFFLLHYLPILIITFLQITLTTTNGTLLM